MMIILTVCWIEEAIKMLHNINILTKPEILVEILKLVIRFLRYASKSVEMEKLNLE